MRKTLLLFIIVGLSLYNFAQEIQFETTEHDFGLINYEDPAEFDFVFTNIGTEPLIVQKPQSTAGVIIRWYPQDPIMPGKKGIIKIAYRTNRTGVLNKRIIIVSNAINSSQVVLRIKGGVLEKGIKALRKNGFWGVEDNEGKVIIPFEFDEMKLVYDGLVLKKNGMCGLVTMTNKIVIPFEYEELVLKSSLDDNIYAKKNGKWGALYKSSGTIKIPFEYETLDEVP